MKRALWIELIGAIAVVVSLGLLTWELNQANRLGTFEANAAVSQGYNELNKEMASNPELANLFALLARSDPELTDVQIQSAIGLAYWHMNNWNTVEAAYEQGWVPQAELQNALNDIRVVTKLWPGLSSYLRLAVGDTNEGVALGRVNSLILELTAVY